MSKVLIVLYVIAYIGCAAPTIDPVLDVIPPNAEEEKKPVEPVKVEEEKQEEEKKLPPLTGTLLEAISGKATDDVVLRHIAKGIGINAKDPEDGWTPLHFAALGRSFGVIVALKSQGANIDVKDKYDDTARSGLANNPKLTPKQRVAAYLLLGGKKSDAGYKSLEEALNRS